MSLLDQHGRPIATGKLKQRQTDRIPGTVRYAMGDGASYTSISQVKQALDGAKRGNLFAQAFLFEEMQERDDQISTEMAKRVMALTGLAWSVEPPPDATPAEEKAAQTVEDLLEQLDMEATIGDLARAIGYGYACVEIEWSRSGSVWAPNALHPRPQTWFQTPQEMPDTLHLRNASSPDGEPLNPWGWITHIHRARSGYPARAGLFRTLIWPYLFKHYSMRDWLRFIELHGLPVRVGRYDASASPEDQEILLDAVVGLGNDFAGIVPEGMSIELLEATKSDSKPFEAMLRWCDAAISKVLVGGTLTSQADGKSSTNALGTIHNTVRQEIRNSDARAIARTLNRDLLHPIAALNHGVADKRRAPRFHFHTEEPEDISTLAGSIATLVNTGMKLPRREMQRRLGLPEPEEGEEILAPLGTTAPPQAPQQAEAATRLTACPHCSGEHQTSLSAAPSEGKDVVEQYTAQAMERLPQAMDPLMAPIRALLSEVSSLEEFGDRLPDLFPDMDTDEFVRLLNDGTTAAHLAGRHEAEHGR
ncbi:MAG: DUF935 domain-containing protein [Magnetococcales bacterium]|nr:DUF935 domain-containing protein [Magnetococcales bacterium]